MEIILSNHVVWSKFGIKEKLTQHILEEIYRQLQPVIISTMNGHETELPFELVKQEYIVSIPFNDLRAISHHTHAIENSIREIQAIQIEFPTTRTETFNKKKRRVFVYTQRSDNFCVRTDIKTTTVETQKESGEPGESIISKTAAFYFTFSQLRNLMLIRKDADGKAIDYTRWANDKVRNTRNKYSPRMHHLLSSMGLGHKRIESFNYWKEFLCVKGKRKENDEIVEFDYCPFFCDFKRYVLDPVKKELDKGDIRFDYSVNKGKETTITITRLTVLQVSPDGSLV